MTTQHLAPVVEELRAREHDGELSVAVFDLAASYAHMLVNRMLRSEHRFQELAINDLLDRLYRAQVAVS